MTNQEISQKLESMIKRALYEWLISAEGVREMGPEACNRVRTSLHHRGGHIIDVRGDYCEYKRGVNITILTTD